VTAAMRVLEILREVNHQGAATVKALHERTGIDKATVVRMLETLIHEGYVMADPDVGAYRVTARVLMLSDGFEPAREFAALSETILSEFRNDIGWPSDIALCDQDAMIVVRTTRGPGPLSFNRRAGYRAPILDTSIGKAYLSFCPDDERTRILASLKGTDDPRASDDAALRTLVKTTRERGYATMEDSYCRREYKGSLWAMAVPVMSDSKIYAALNIMMLCSAVTHEMAVERYLEPLKRTAARLAETFQEHLL
jgi:IclR family mhp operon transcriptional activator